MIPTWIIVTLSVLVFIVLAKVIHKVTKRKRVEREKINHQRFLRRISKWEVGDELVLHCYNEHHAYSRLGEMYRTAEKNLNSPRKWPVGRVKLIKWSEEEIIYETENGSQFYGNHSNIDWNRSSDNRMRDGKMDNFMDSLNDTSKFREERLSELLDKEGEKSEEEEES